MNFSKIKTVLVVDDEQDQRELIYEILHGKYEVIQAKDGQTAIDMFTKYKEKIDVILLDLQLPDMSGREVFQKFREITVTEIPNIIVVSGSNDPEDIIDSFTENDAFFHLEKPYSTKELIAVIEQSLTESMSIRQNKRIAQDAALRRILIDRNVRILNERITVNMKYGKILSADDAQSLSIRFENIINAIDGREKVVKFLEEDTGIKAPKRWSPKILFVEDELDFQELLRDYLVLKGYVIYSAASVKEAREVIQKQLDLDIILLDMGLPDGYGKEIIEDLTEGIEEWYKHKNSLLTTQPDIVVHSAYIDRDTIRDVIRAGALTYVNKPAPCSDVHKKLESVFEQRYQLSCIRFLSDELNNQDVSHRTMMYEESLKKG